VGELGRLDRGRGEREAIGVESRVSLQMCGGRLGWRLLGGVVVANASLCYLLKCH
jgi:hypothetical protein